VTQPSSCSLSLVLRTASMYSTSFFTVCLSAMALRSGVAVEFWGILRHLGLAREKQWIKGFCAKVAGLLRIKATEGSSARVGLTGAEIKHSRPVPVSADSRPARAHRARPAQIQRALLQISAMATLRVCGHLATCSQRIVGPHNVFTSVHVQVHPSRRSLAAHTVGL
jgi:hypothetical protein